MQLRGNTVTFSLAELSETALARLVELAEQVEGENEHLASGVPREFADVLENAAVKWATLATLARHESRNREIAREAQQLRLEQAIAARRGKQSGDEAAALSSPVAPPVSEDHGLAAPGGSSPQQDV